MSISEPITLLRDLPQFTFRNHTTRGAWLAGRMSCIGASDSPAIFGDGYADQNMLTVWNSKVYGDPDDEVDESLAIGQLIEPALRSIFSYKTGLPCESPGQLRIYVHPQYEWIGATLDGLTRHPEYGVCSVELKNVGQYRQTDWEDDQPLQFQIQCQQQMAVLGSSHAFLMGLIGGNKPIVHVLERDQEFIDTLIEILREFWGFVDRKELPPLDDTVTTARTLGKIFKEDAGLSVCLPPEAKDWAVQLQQAKEVQKSEEARELLYGNKIREAIGAATYGDIPGWGRMSWKTQSRSGHYVKPSTFRVLRKCKS